MVASSTRISSMSFKFPSPAVPRATSPVTPLPVTERKFGEGAFLRPNFIQPYNCKNILIEDVTIIRSPMWEIHPVLSSNITVRGVKINSHGINNDGCNPESSTDVLIEDCVFDTGDDCIAMRSGNCNAMRTPWPLPLLVHHSPTTDWLLEPVAPWSSVTVRTIVYVPGAA